MTRPIGIFYEHPDWFTGLFDELNRRGISHEPILAHQHSFDPSNLDAQYDLVVNRVSSSSYLRAHESAIFHAHQYLALLEAAGVPVVNGALSYTIETSKARQLTLMSQLGIPHPRSRVVNSVDAIHRAATELEYPLILKPNIGGAGALIRRIDDADELASVAPEELTGIFGVDRTALVQEYHAPVGGGITRIEMLDDQFLYAIRIRTDHDQGFNICPADLGPSNEGDAEESASAPSPLVEAVQPPDWTTDAVRTLFQAASIDVGGMEFLESERDGNVYFYDVNALSNFVADAPNVVGFDPFSRFVDYLERRVDAAQSTAYAKTSGA